MTPLRGAGRDYQQAEGRSGMEKDKEKSAELNVRIKADTGYRSSETHRISVDQWRRIISIMYEE